jgi:hypothetical protein
MEIKVCIVVNLIVRIMYGRNLIGHILPGIAELLDARSIISYTTLLGGEMMKQDRYFGMLLLVVGIVGIAIISTADLTGLGGHPGFGPRQTAGTFAGILLIVAGGALVRGDDSRED